MAGTSPAITEISFNVRSLGAEQPDPGHIKSHRLGHEGLPRSGHVPDALLDRLQFLLARLTITALAGPLLMALGAALLGGRALEIGIARFGERFARRSGRLTRGWLGRLLSLRW